MSKLSLSSILSALHRCNLFCPLFMYTAKGLFSWTSLAMSNSTWLRTILTLSLQGSPRKKCFWFLFFLLVNGTFRWGFPSLYLKRKKGDYLAKHLYFSYPFNLTHVSSWSLISDYALSWPPLEDGPLPMSPNPQCSLQPSENPKLQQDLPGSPDNTQPCSALHPRTHSLLHYSLDKPFYFCWWRRR